MRGLKILLAGFLFILTGVSLLILLTIPNAPLLLINPSILSTYGTISSNQISFQEYTNTVNFIRIVEGISALLIIGGLVLTAFGAFYKAVRQNFLKTSS